MYSLDKYAAELVRDWQTSVSHCLSTYGAERAKRLLPHLFAEPSPLSTHEGNLQVQLAAERIGHALPADYVAFAKLAHGWSITGLSFDDRFLFLGEVDSYSNLYPNQSIAGAVQHGPFAQVRCRFNART
jgi:hypothetical protein